jgi:hypothetical protein
MSSDETIPLSNQGCCPTGVPKAAEWDLLLSTYSLIIVINIASVKRKIIKPKYPVACSRSVGAAGERDLLWSNYAFVCGGSAGELCLSCAAPIAPALGLSRVPDVTRQAGFEPGSGPNRPKPKGHPYPDKPLQTQLHRSNGL